jgi:protein-disulfide isomerase
MRRFNLRKCTGILVLTLFFGSAAVAQQEEEASLRQQIEELKKGQDEIRKELADIKKLLQASAARAAAPAAPDVRNLVLDVGSNPFRGEVTAKLTLVEFTDYQ